MIMEKEMSFNIDNEEYLDLDEVIKLTGINQAYIYMKIKYEGFPKPENKTVPTPRKRKLWKKSEIETYIELTRK
jgi:predicted DNA-binding transcriptional regulator AlpA